MAILKTIQKTIFVPIHPAGYPFIVIFLGLTILLSVFLGQFFLFAGLILTVWCIYFFRNPIRYTPQHSSLVISPADGRILSIAKSTPPINTGLEGEEWTKISIFMNVFDVHVNRAPMEGKIINKTYFPGSFLDASLDKASEKNERLSLTMQTTYGKDIAFVQIAGLIARRILCDVSIGSELKQGEQYGIIRFGSRVDVWLPNPISPQVIVGQRTYAGETILADFRSSDEPYQVRIQ